MSDEERTRFEKSGLKSDDWHWSEKNQRYSSGKTQGMWAAWQAALAGREDGWVSVEEHNTVIERIARMIDTTDLPEPTHHTPWGKMSVVNLEAPLSDVVRMLKRPLPNAAGKSVT